MILNIQNEPGGIFPWVVEAHNPEGRAQPGYSIAM